MDTSAGLLLATRATVLRVNVWMPKIALQPKQWQVRELITRGVASWIGMGGGRGGAKSAAIQRIALSLMMEEPCVICIVMRNYDQVRKYHIEPMMRSFPDIEQFMIQSKSKLKIPVKGGYSEIDFSYAENLVDVERRFRSANYKYIFVDQAEQFIEPELREIKQANRFAGAAQGVCKTVLAFNMGGAGIQTLRKWFHTKEYGKLERPEDFAFVHVYPWDNVEWVRSALKEDSYTERDYYSWSNEARMAYAEVRGDYTKNLNSQDEALRQRDWFGSWESLEGAYFGRVWDLQAVQRTPDEIGRVLKEWSNRWLTQDWGKGHFNVTYWLGRHVLSPSEIKDIFGWVVDKPVGCVCFYREQVVSELGSSEVAAEIVKRTPMAERKFIKRFFLSPDAFGERDSENTIAIKQGVVMKDSKLPAPEQADTDRIGGAGLLYNLLLETKRIAAGTWQGGDILLISSECTELLQAFPAVMRDPKNIDDILKTDKGQARIEQDSIESARYGCKSMLAPNQKVPIAVQAAVIAQSTDDAHERSMRMREFEVKVKHGTRRRSSWRRS